MAGVRAGLPGTTESGSGRHGLQCRTMKILAIETSCDRGSIALSCDAGVLEQALPGLAQHSRQVIPALQGLLGEAGLLLSQLDAVCFGSGPGAFTGLRLACGVAQGLALGAQLGVLAVNSLEALAWGAGVGAWESVIDARMGEVYRAAYQVAADGVQCVREPECAHPDVLEPLPGSDWNGVGSGFAVYPALPARWQGRMQTVLSDRVPTAAGIARLAELRLQRGQSLSAPSEVAPFYVRDKVALTTAERLARGGRL